MQVNPIPIRLKKLKANTLMTPKKIQPARLNPNINQNMPSFTFLYELYQTL